MIALARPRKDGLDYFPLDVDLFEDYKIKILKARYGADGIILYLYLLCRIYRQGYYMQVNEDFEYIISEDLKMSPDKVKQVLTFLLSRSLFDNTLFQSDAVLTSAGIQKRFQLAVKERAKKNPIKTGRYWLLKKEETEPFIKCTLFGDYSGKNENYSGKNPDKSREQSLKESKVKKHSHNYGGMLPEQVQALREELEKLSSDDKERIAIVKKATAGGWKSFYPLKKRTKEPKKEKKNGFNNFEGRDYSGQMDDLTRALIEGGKNGDIHS